ncbi:MAG TPA: hypothetical protein DCE14_07620 [Kosmotogaceae bacterium]|nr:MAG: hypothetical protein XE05_1057 [Thermotogales bacterium 46_20]HAA86196.1 hypothetical protein [Kosmotogaceae bacterium]
MSLSLSSQEYDRLIEVCEKLSGSVEPGYRFIKIYFRNGPRFFATDGCAKLELPAGSGSSCFEGTYVLPLDYAKALKNQPEVSEISFSFSDETLLLETDTQKLTIQKSRLPGHPEMERKFEYLFGIQVKEFTRKLDYVSSISNEGDLIEIAANSESVLMISQAAGMTAVSFIDIPAKHKFTFSIPYVTSRHLVKALSLTKAGNLSFGTGIAELGLKTGRMLFSLCRLNETKSSAQISSIRNWPGSPVRIDKRKLTGALRKACSLIGRGLSILLVSENRKVRLYLKTANMRYEEKLTDEFSEDFITKVDPHRLRAALSRLPGDSVLLGRHANAVLLADGKGSDFILIPEIR